VTHSRAEIRELLQSSGLAPSRALGQNFVADPNTVRRIARLAEIGPNDHVVEIGAGLGSLTLALAESGASVTAIEIDRGIVPVLTAQAGVLSNVEIVEADAMSADWSKILSNSTVWTLVANLPYNVATPLVCDLLDFVPAITSMLVMVQREVGERFVAQPGSKAYGAVSVKVAYWADAKIVGSIPASVFVPRPNVESALVRIDRRSPPVVDHVVMFELIRQSFGQRRKMLRRSLAGSVTDEQFVAADVSPEQRPEQLGLADWCRLTAAVRS
jgi:16S rRNA (adenine1518-N6/adenine1519-N6)-dimethyltransferase